MANKIQVLLFIIIIEENSLKLLLVDGTRNMTRNRATIRINNILQVKGQMAGVIRLAGQAAGAF